MNVAIVLAAGGSTRFGAAKQLAELHGETLVERALRCCTEAGLLSVLVVGANAVRVAALVDPDVLVRNDRWEEGMGTSIAAGVAAAVELGADSVVILPIDVPSLRPEDLTRLVEAQVGVDASAASYDDVVGIPACFGRPCFPMLASLRGDEGARRWLRDGSLNVVAVPMACAAADVDRPEDLG